MSTKYVSSSIKDDGSGELVFDRANKRNALNSDLIDQAVAAINDLAERGVTVATISGNGPIFCSGVDVSGGLDPEVGRLSGTDLIEALLASPIFWVAHIQGPALGAGVGITAACPLSVVSESAWFSLPEIDLGLFPCAVIAYLEPRLGRQFSLQWGLTGTRMTAAEAHQRGLASIITSPENSQSVLQDLVSHLLATPWATRSALMSWQATFRSDDFVSRKRELDLLMSMPPKSWKKG